MITDESHRRTLNFRNCTGSLKNNLDDFSRHMLFGFVSFDPHTCRSGVAPFWDLGPGTMQRADLGSDRLLGVRGLPPRFINAILYRFERGGGGPNTQKFIFHCKTYGKETHGHPKHPKHPKHPNTQNTQKAHDTQKTPTTAQPPPRPKAR